MICVTLFQGVKCRLFYLLAKPFMGHKSATTGMIRKRWPPMELRRPSTAAAKNWMAQVLRSAEMPKTFCMYYVFM